MTDKNKKEYNDLLELLKYNNKREAMKTIDLKFSELCEELDYYKDSADYWKKMYDEEIRKSSIRSTEALIEAKRGVANALKFALVATDDAKGNLVIKKEDRDIFADHT